MKGDRKGRRVWTKRAPSSYASEARSTESLGGSVSTGSQGAPGLGEHMGVLSDDQLWLQSQVRWTPLGACHILSMVLKVRSLARVPVQTCLDTPELGEMKLISPSVFFCQGENNGPKRRRHSLKFLSRRGSSPRCRTIVQFLENSLRDTHSPESPWAVILQLALHRDTESLISQRGFLSGHVFGCFLFSLLSATIWPPQTGCAGCSLCTKLHMGCVAMRSEFQHYLSRREALMIRK